MSTPRAAVQVVQRRPRYRSQATRFITRLLGLEHDGVAALLAHDRRDLEPDIAAADDDDAPRVIERRA